MDLNLILVPLVIGLGLCTALLGLWLILAAIKSRGRVFKALSMSLFLIILPKAKKQEGGQQKPDKELIAVMEQLYGALGSFKISQKNEFVYGPTIIALEIAVPHIGQEVSFYIAVSKKIESVVEKQIHGCFPEAQVEKIKDYNIFNPKGAASAAFVRLNRNYYLPFKTYKELERDPLAEIVNAFSKLKEEGEGAALQIILKPAPSGWQKRTLKIAREMQKNKTIEKAVKETSFLKTVSKDFGGEKKKDQPALAPAPLTPLQQEQIKALEEKASKVGFEANIRLAASAATQARADEILSELEGAFAQFNHPNFNGLKIVRATGRLLQKLIYNFSFRIFSPNEKIILNTEELTSLFHLPMVEVGAPQLKFLKSKQAAAPANIPKTGLILGKNVFRGQEIEARIQDDDRRRHLYIIGQTGTGKSTLIYNLVAQDILVGKGVGVLDPHGDLVERILSIVPAERAEDVILIDPADLERPVGLNMLEYDSRYPEQKSNIVDELIGIFDKLYDLKTTGGPIFEQYTRNALLLLMDDPQELVTLMEVPKVLADKEFRTRLLQKCKNPVVKDFWEKEAEKAGGEASLQNMVPYITSKFNVFIANDYMRPIIGQVKSTINYRQIIDTKKILLINLSKGRLGDINSSLLGLINVGKLLMAAFSRIDLPEEQRQDFYLYIDEFQNFTTDSIATILSEARKYRLDLTIAHQFIGQLSEKIKAAVFGNVGSMLVMRVGAEDAEFLVKQFEPVFDKNDLINIDNFNVYVKLLISGATSAPFNIQTYPPQKGNLEMNQTIKQLARLKYGREKSAVEEEIRGRWQG